MQHLRSIPLVISALFALGCGPSDVDPKDGDGSNNGSNNATNNSTNNVTNNGTSDIEAPNFRGVAVASDFAEDASGWSSIIATSGELDVGETPMAALDVGVSAGERWVYVLDRTFDVVRVIDPMNDLEQHAELTFAGGASNPHTAVDVDGKTYVSFYNTGQIGVVDGIDAGSTEVDTFIDLTSHDDDQNPEPAAMVVDGTDVLVVLQTLTEFAGVADSQLAIIDSTTDEVTAVVPLEGRKNAAAGLRPIPGSSTYSVGWTGDYGAMDGGIAVLDGGDPAAAALTDVIDEAALGGDLLDHVMVDEHRGYAVISLPDFSSQLVAFDTGDGEPTVEVIDTIEAPAPGLAITGDGAWLAVGDRGADRDYTFFSTSLGTYEKVWSAPLTYGPAGFAFTE